jgi:hypothetical protein
MLANVRRSIWSLRGQVGIISSRSSGAEIGIVAFRYWNSQRERRHEHWSTLMTYWFGGALAVGALGSMDVAQTEAEAAPKVV